MAQYKVPQNVEADDKLLGPFSFRQFVYLMIAGGLIALAVGLFQLFPLLAVVPIPFVLFFGVLALPLKKDQPMETYLVAVVSYYLKPKNKTWKAGQRDTTIQITAPKVVDEGRTRDFTGEEAVHRLSFLAEVVDSEGRSIKGGFSDHASAELAYEATNTADMFETSNFNVMGNMIQREENARHNEVVNEMRNQIAASENLMATGAKVEKRGEERRWEKVETPVATTTGPSEPAIRQAPNFASAAVVMPDVAGLQKQIEEMEEKRKNEKAGLAKAVEKTEVEEKKVKKASEAAEKVEKTANSAEKSVENAKKAETVSENSSIIELANNKDYSVATIAKEAKRIKAKEKGEVFISLH